MDKITLGTKKVSIEFPGVKALSDCDFEISTGMIHAVMGANGAGSPESRRMGERPQLLFRVGSGASWVGKSAHFPFSQRDGESAKGKKAIRVEKARGTAAGCRIPTRQRQDSGALAMADNRNISMHFWASQEEYDLIQKNMELSGSTNLSAFLRKMAIDGMVIRLDMPQIQELLRQLRRFNANVNQIAKHLHETGRVYDTDLEEILAYQAETRKGLSKILAKLSNLQ